MKAVASWRSEDRHDAPCSFALNMEDHVLERQLLLPIRQKDAWEFFSTPLNLARITPPYMGFEIMSEGAHMPIHSGMLIRYRVRPLIGIPLGWTTEIRNVDRPFGFTDVQLKGPFAKWEHHHRFIGTPQGIRIEDRVVYRLPFGPIGRLVHRALVRNRLEAIFDHRERTLRAIFAVE